MSGINIIMGNFIVSLQDLKQESKHQETNYHSVMKRIKEKSEKSMQEAETKHNGNPAHDYLIMMIPHHQQAIDESEAILLYTSDPRARELAKNIIKNQTAEIEYMKKLLSTI